MTTKLLFNPTLKFQLHVIVSSHYLTNQTPEQLEKNKLPFKPKDLTKDNMTMNETSSKDNTITLLKRSYLHNITFPCNHTLYKNIVITISNFLKHWRAFEYHYVTCTWFSKIVRNLKT